MYLVRNEGFTNRSQVFDETWFLTCVHIVHWIGFRTLNTTKILTTLIIRCQFDV